MAIDLGPHQIQAMNELHNGSILNGGVGVGKSRTALAYFYIKECEGQIRVNGVGENGPVKSPMDLYIITTAKKRDSLEWEAEAVKFGISTSRDHHSGINLVVDSWNNILNYEHVTDAFFFFDEQRLVGSGAWVKAFLKIAKRNRWILLSATPGDNWMDYIPVFIANGYYKNRTEFLQEHVVFSRYSKFPKVERYIGRVKLERLRHNLLVEMPFHGHTTRIVRNIPVRFDKELYEVAAKNRWNPYTEKPLRDIADLFRVVRQIVNADPSRLAAIMELHEKHPKLIVFYNFDYELMALRTLAETLGVAVAEWNGKKHQDIPKAEKWIYLVQYKAGAEGWNCIETDAMVFYSLNYSWKATEQAKGRIDRMNTPFTNLYYYFLRTAAQIDVLIAHSLVLKEEFNEKKVKLDALY